MLERKRHLPLKFHGRVVCEREGKLKSLQGEKTDFFVLLIDWSRKMGLLYGRKVEH